MPSMESAAKPKNLASLLGSGARACLCREAALFLITTSKALRRLVALDNASRFYKSLTFFV
jgi:hypothetical protein